MTNAGLLIIGLMLSTGEGGADEHMLAGAQSFRDGRFDEALVEFRVAQRLGASDAAMYSGAALVMLGRAEEAMEAFGGTEVTRGGDGLIDYYRALACYEARLYQCADRILAGLGKRSGPRVAELARRVRADIAAAVPGEPTKASIDWYLSSCSARMQAGRLLLARAYCQEAATLADRRKDRYRISEVAELTARLGGLGARGGGR